MRRVLTFAFLLAIVFGSLVVTAQDTPVTVRLWMHNHPPRIALDEELIAQFEAENPTIDVEFTVVPDQEWDTTLNTAIAAGDVPDLFNQATFAIGQFYAQGLLAPVNAEAAGYADQQAIIDAYSEGENLLAGAMFDGTLYGLPTELSTYACFTNDALWEAAGLDPATDFPATWEGLAEVAQQLTVRDDAGAITQRGFDFIWSNSIFMMLTFNAMVQQLGGNMIDEVNYTANMTSPEVKQVMGYYNSLANEWQVGGPQYQFVRDAFLAGQVGALCEAGNWFAPQIDNAGFAYTIHPIPRWESNVNDSALANYAYFFMVSASAAPEVQEAAWKLAGFLTSAPDRYLETAGLFQGKADFVSSEAFAADEVMPVFMEELGKSGYHPRIAGFFEVADAMMRARDRIITGGEDMDAVLSEAEVEVNDILARAKADAEAAGA